MSELMVRRLLVDLETPFGRHWNGGDAFRTAFFDALSMSFPVGEQFFIDSVRAGLQQLGPEGRARFEAEVKGFIGQEATHRRIHALYNAQLDKRGLLNAWEPRAKKRIDALAGIDLRNHLAVTAATEHFTAIFAEYLLTNPLPLQGAEARMDTLWRWHSSEESEHRSTAFDLYRALGGNEEWRLRIFRVVSFNFIVDALRQTALNLWRDGSWWKPGTWVSGLRFLFGRNGLVRQLRGPWREYLREDFHPQQADDRAARDWLATNTQAWRPVGG
jgi:predicted metal-dependent hydrolase